MKSTSEKITTFIFTCNGCGEIFSPPAVTAEYARKLAHLHGWYLGDQEEFCKKCTAEKQTDGLLGPRPNL